MNQLSVIQQTKINKNEKIKELSLGLRVGEVVKMRPEDIDSKRMLIHIKVEYPHCVYPPKLAVYLQCGNKQVI